MTTWRVSPTPRMSEVGDVTDLVVITGASSGLGAALATTIPFPAHVVDVSRSGPKSDIDHITADLSDPTQWTHVGAEISRLVSQHNPARAVLIHNAGTLTPIGFAGEVDDLAYQANVLLNSAAGQALGHHFLKAVSGRPGRHELVMITSGAATSPYAGWSAYGAGKAALNQWVRNVGLEQRDRGGVIVAAIAPGVVDTSMQAEIRETSGGDFPTVGRFHDLHSEGHLVSPVDAAQRIWNLIESGIEGGSVLELRQRS
jgi:benzil reductase ((S)-benzoin forming)